MSVGTILVRDLTIDCIIGILPTERTTPQPLIVDVDLHVDFAASIASENVADTVNYAEVCMILEQLAVDGKYQLVETYAAHACSNLIDRYPEIQHIKITIKKPQAVANSRYVGVELEQSRA